MVKSFIISLPSSQVKWWTCCADRRLHINSLINVIAARVSITVIEADKSVASFHSNHFRFQELFGKVLLGHLDVYIYYRTLRVAQQNQLVHLAEFWSINATQHNN